MLREAREGTILQVIVRPNAKENKIEGIDEWRNRLKVSVKAPPVGGKANKELVKFLSKFFGAEVEIVRGETSREKDLLVKLGIEEVKRRLKL
ncbi:hypothetical protein A3L04_04210 [Thermococcus chitonophagus]|uniref:UPF0235 protein A3L04_04210 n=1 Tax=Thermococcus chitonophagus TaxID=54262 RepID=A0A160VU20_9EURY|nr:DUF167 domain-containing protein [Thermococcus chitonophagus]ASJ16331.1 hypothetical protein A3L04_04210 [Thermococcus chitonophagus]CUX78677.1 UPF0235 protein MJ0618 [Thermococcus chitonophagus]